ncbi:hypothetical protein AAFN85_28495 [Mucilaginibacter sp. CAU 1740]|uniref:hypothetical protein n=1 Tax=Mucilaginibacter sp. CAU 1740 TaxID=3140365 RepID=UPI00325AEC10
MKTYQNLINLGCVFLILLAACKKNGSVTPEKPDTTSNVDPIVYVSGSTYDSVTTKWHAIYWKNANPVVLNNDDNVSSANAIAVNGNDVYAAGYTTADNANIYIATYWKNGAQVNLTNASGRALASAIAIQGNDVYIAGSVNALAVYWKNGQLVNLPLLPNMTVASTSGIAVQGTDVYVSGYQYGATGGPSAVYWKNGVPVKLPANQMVYAGTNMVVQNGHTYIPAAYVQASAQSTIPNYWKDGQPVSLADGSLIINAASIDVNGNDVYVACGTTKGGAYFKNSKITLLSGSDAEIAGIKVFNNDVYASGQSTHEKKSEATYWKNNVPVYLTSSIGKAGYGSAIAVIASK